VELLFLCNSEEYAETVPGTSFKEYPQYSYIPHKPGPKPRFPEPASLSLTDLSRKTPIVAKTESILYGTTLKLSGGALEEVLPPSKEERKGPKRIRGTLTKWKCSECAVPICRVRSDCWEKAYRRLFNR
jgi:hypothetical protein